MLEFRGESEIAVAARSAIRAGIWSMALATRLATPAGQVATALAISGLLAYPITAQASDTDSLEAAVQALNAGHDEATAAVYELQAAGTAAAELLRDAWPSLSPLAQARALAVLRSLASRHDAAVQALTQAARSPDERLVDRALAALRESGKRGRLGLVSLLGDPDSGDRAAAVLARSDPDFAVAPLLEALSTEGGSERPGLRDALVVAVQRAEDPTTPLSTWLEAGPPPAALASAAFGLGSVEGYEQLLTSLVEGAIDASDDFSTTWRLLQSAGSAGPSASVDAWVVRHLREPDAWMLRSAAVDAAAARGSRARVRAALDDPYPRVRAAAATALEGEPSSMLERATLARKDLWPMVRAAAVKSLRKEADATPIVVAAVNDSMSVVRVAAIDVLTESPHDQGWEDIHARLRAKNEWPAVTEAAIGYVVAHCRTDAAESLFRVVLRAGASNALTEDLNAAARAIEALRALGTPEADAVIERLRAEPEVPPTLQMALSRPAPEGAACGQTAP